MFKDALGNEWHPRITVGTIARFEEETGITIPEIFKPENISKVSVVTRLAFHACARQVRERKMDFEKFADSFENDTQLKAMTDSVVSAIRSFFQSQGTGPASGATESRGAGPASTK
jgi:hypothetical protein